MSLPDLLRPRVSLTAGALLALTLPLAILAGASATLAVVAVRREKPLRELLAAGAKIAEDAEGRVRTLDELLTGIADISGMVSSAKRVIQRASANASAETPTAPTPPRPSTTNGATTA